MKVKIKDFQAIKNAELEFNPGITVIVGNSNNGKSSIIRAIEAAINNKGGNGFINYDADKCEVTISYNKNKIKWIKHKKQGKSSYEINGERLSKIGQKQLDEVGELLNMQQVEINNDRFRLNFWKQLDYPFLVGKTSYQLFDFISKSNEQELMSGLQEETAENLKNTVSDITNISRDVDKKTAEITSIKDKLKELNKYNKVDVDSFLQDALLLDKIGSNIITLKDLISELKDIKKDVYKKNDMINTLNKHFDTLDKGFAIYNSLNSAISEFNQNKELIDSFDINSINNDIENYKNKLSAIDKIFEEYKNIEDQYNTIKNINLEISDNAYSLEEYEEKLDAVMDEMTKAATELGTFDVCPLCGQSLNKGDHVHDGK